ncbi:hypothetical protein PPTG_03308 [Phytophthora nicotianae INRA-310]|uniref:M96 mating-specific protein family n=1 Tax=Phytophthora nicotianae (strain INRA-310) TaxID=761204 RepID=W2R4W9_PHYN3|nr:hypothetical protein PPTG_03308 [Phytophthora nicotianae INRA-310]ETN20271.1 hypothetical protein PPTG_03308 [Phytophthora nicotianae INRA-310]
MDLVEDDQVLEAALSLVEAWEQGEVSAKQPVTVAKKTAKKKRNYNPNRAREEQRKELLALREELPALEKRLKMLHLEMENMNIRAMSVGKQETINLWRKMALYQRQTRLSAEEENKRLRELIREHNEVTNRSIQHILSSKQGHVETIERLPDPWPCRRQYPVPLGSNDNYLFKDMAGTIDFVQRQVLRVLALDTNSGTETDVTLFPSAKNAHPRLFADKILPYSVELTGDVAWQYFAHSFRRPTTRFYYHTETNQSSGLVHDDTIVESFGEEHRFGKVLFDFKVKQIVRRYVAAGRVVIAWRALLSPEAFKGESLSGIQFEEKGALVIEPFQTDSNSACVVHTWQMITPDITDNATKSGRTKLVQDMTEFLLQGCRPERAVESLERALRAQSMQMEATMMPVVQ